MNELILLAWSDLALVGLVLVSLTLMVVMLIQGKTLLAKALGVLAALLSALLGGKLWERGGSKEEDEKSEPQGLEEETGPGLVTEVKVKPPLRPAPTPTKDLSEVIDDAPPPDDIRTDGHLSDTPGDHKGVPPGSQWWDTSND
jgi:hypothetical protein